MEFVYIWLVLSYVIGGVPWKDFNLHCKVYETFYNVPRPSLQRRHISLVARTRTE